MVWGIISEARSLRASYRTNTLISNVSAKGLIAHEALGWLPTRTLPNSESFLMRRLACPHLISFLPLCHRFSVPPPS